MGRPRAVPFRHWLPPLAAAVVLLTACSSGARPDRAGPVDIGDGREIHLECHGTGSPTVVLVSGLGDNAEICNTPPTAAAPSDPESPTVYGDVARFTRVCAYDRPGTNGSVPPR